MAFQMIHMEVAYRLLNRIPQIENAAEFILGSVAPDSVHMNPDYNIEMKVKSHMFESCGMWSDTQDYQRWMNNIEEYFYQIAGEKDKAAYRDFCFGICVHCMTDYWNDLRIWRKLQGQYIPPMSLEEFRDSYYPEARGIDKWLYQNSEHTKAIRKLLEAAMVVEADYLNLMDIESQRKHLLTTQYDVDTVDISQYCYLSADIIEEFITFTVNDIAEKIAKWI